MEKYGKMNKSQQYSSPLLTNTYKDSWMLLSKETLKKYATLTQTNPPKLKLTDESLMGQVFTKDRQRENNYRLYNI